MMHWMKRKLLWPWVTYAQANPQDPAAYAVRTYGNGTGNEKTTPHLG